MRVIVTGGSGFLGQKLTAALLARGGLTDAAGNAQPIAELVLVDVRPAAPVGDRRVVSRVGDLNHPAFVRELFSDPVHSVFHLAAVVSAEAEQDFDLGWRVNVDATRLLLEAARAQQRRSKFVFASSVAVFGGRLPDRVGDDQVVRPQSSYGAQKAVGEHLVYDYTRKGFVDGRSLRLPTVAVRPGAPNKAASSFASAILREPLNGAEAVCPVPADTRMWLLSPRAAVDNMIAGHEAAGERFEFTRSVNVPGISATVGDMIVALRRVAGGEVSSRIRWNPDPAVMRIVETWPRDFEAAFGRAIGMRADAGLDAIIRQYIDDELRRP
jgi:nucleoside-diphosphate-sugar epimerase